MKLAVYGAGGAGRELLEMIRNAPDLMTKWEEICFIDDTREVGVFRDCPIMPFDVLCKTYGSDEVKLVIAVGEPQNRFKLYERIKQAGYQMATLVDPSAHVFQGAVLGEGVIIKEQVYVSTDTIIGDNVCINGGSTIIGHDVHIGAHCQISSNVVIAGNTTVGAGTYVGTAASIRDHIEIGKNCIVSMGAAVMKSVEDERIVMGNPARIIGVNNEGKIFK